MTPTIRVECTESKVTVSVPMIVDGKSWNLIFNYNSNDEYLLCSIAEKAREAISKIDMQNFDNGYKQRDYELKSKRREYRMNAQKRKQKAGRK